MDKKHRVVAVVALVFLAGLPVVGAAAGGSAASSQNATDLTLDELRRGGEQPDGKAPSTRWLSDSENVYIDYPHTNPIRRDSGESWQIDQLLRSGELVRTDKLRFHGSGPRDAAEREYTLKVAYWNVGERNNQTVATNVTVESKTLKFSGSSGVAEVNLRSHYDSPKRVTMWLLDENGEPFDGARWRFQHHTLETETPIATNTAGERLWWLLSEVLIWLLFGGIGMLAVVLGAKKRAGEGPMKGMVWWVIAIVLVGGVSLIYVYESVAEVFIDGPQILALATVALLAIPILESERSTDKWLWLKPELIKAKSASGGAAQDSIKWVEDTRKVTRMPDGRLAVVESGIGKFFARLFGGVAHLKGVEDLPTMGRAVGRTGYEKIAFTKASADEALNYEPEGWTVSLPTGLGELIPLGILAIVLATVGQAWIGSTWLGVLALPLLAIRPKGGEATFEPANAHQRQAYVTMLYGAIEHEEAETLEESRDKLLREKSRNQRHVEQALEQADKTLLEEAVTAETPNLDTIGADEFDDEPGDLDDLDEDEDGQGFLERAVNGVLSNGDE